MSLLRQLTQWGRRCVGALVGLVKVGLSLVVCGAVALEVVASAGSYDRTLLDRRPEPSLVVVDAQGGTLADRANAKGLRHRWASLSELSPWVVRGTVAVEDANFYLHRGVDWSAVWRASVNNVRLGRVASGASTITMQLARMLQPYERRSVWGKLTATMRALRLERAASKDEIMEHYLNRAPYGAGTVGVEAASFRYFGRPSKALSLSEATLLVGLPGAPTKFNPLRFYERALRRRGVVLRRLLEEGHIDLAQWAQALSDRPKLTPGDNPRTTPHLSDILARESRDGAVQTFIDPGLQRDVARILSDQAQDLAVLGAPHAAAVVVDNRRCDVVAMSGSPDYRARFGAVNGATALRQPGSTLKPFVYGLAFERGAHAGTVVADVPTRYRSPDGTLHAPRNYARTYAGPVSMGRALASSLNVPAIRTAEREGLGRLYERLQKLGFDSLNRPAAHYGLGLALGNGEVRLTELAQAYAALARSGRGCRLRKTSRDPQVTPSVFSAEVAARLTAVLSDESLRVEAFGTAAAMLLDAPVALKSGTSANWRDNWVVGYTREHTVAVWVGDFANRTSTQLTGLAGAGPLFQRVMRRVIASVPKGQRAPLVPASVEQRLSKLAVCPLSGLPVGEHCPHRVQVRGAPHSAHGEAPTVHEGSTCSWHRSARIHRPSGLLAGAGCPDGDTAEITVSELPATYAEWEAAEPARAHGRAPTSFAPACPQGPQDGNDPHAARPSVAGGPPPSPSILWPMAHDTFVVDPTETRERQSVRFRAALPPSTADATWYVNGRVAGRVQWPFELVWPLERGTHVIELAAGGQRSTPVAFKVR